MPIKQKLTQNETIAGEESYRRIKEQMETIRTRSPETKCPCTTKQTRKTIASSKNTSFEECQRIV